MILRLKLTLVIIIVALALPLSGCTASADQRYASADPCIRAQAAGDFSRCDQQHSAERLIRMLDDDDQAVRFYAAAALYRRSGQRFDYQAQDSPRQRAAAIQQAIKWHNETYPQAAECLDDLALRLDELYGEKSSPPTAEAGPSAAE